MAEQPPVAPDAAASAPREGNLDAPTRHPLGWTAPEFWDQAALDAELERVFNICHGCRRCVSLCHAFPTLFDLIDASKTMEIDGVDKADYPKVTEHCYLCDLCYQTKCPYVPPHEWNVDFPHLMLRAKAVDFRRNGAPLSAKILSSTTTGIEASLPTVRVLDRILADSGAPSRSKATALARSIRCGKSTFQGCGGVYGHLT